MTQTLYEYKVVQCFSWNLRFVWYWLRLTVTLNGSSVACQWTTSHTVCELLSFHAFYKENCLKQATD